MIGFSHLIPRHASIAPVPVGFWPAEFCYGGCAWGALGCAGFLEQASGVEHGLIWSLVHSVEMARGVVDALLDGNRSVR
ncbi:hypothetical protein C3L29_004790 [Pseudomonas sp. MWU12-2534b]|nr:hypothetical protein C3L29_004790 [Pseudomonas sp. MWU12-2534b]